MIRVFAHPAQGPEWYWDPEADTSAPSPALCLRYLTELFEDPLRHLRAYSDAQLDRGFWFLVDNACSDHMFPLFDTQIPLEPRRHCVRSIRVLFERLFSERCSSHLSHLDPPDASPLNSSCYMWWDLFPSWGRPKRDVDGELLSVMESILTLESVACQESALHGLGHWREAYPDRVSAIVAGFLRRGGLSRELRQYAVNAQRGCIQ